jgi:hypothetical protein
LQIAPDDRQNHLRACLGSVSLNPTYWRPCSDIIEDTVVRRGGEVVFLEQEPVGLHERLKMTVALPFLNGIPPQWDFLRWSIREGGGIIENVRREWQFFY